VRRGKRRGRKEEEREEGEGERVPGLTNFSSSTSTKEDLLEDGSPSFLRSIEGTSCASFLFGDSLSLIAPRKFIFSSSGIFSTFSKKGIFLGEG
jgi:hypothetical protein